MELFDLRCLVALSHGGGVLGVARAMGRAPSSISTRLQALERDIGVPLFVRGRRSLTLSPQGQLLLEHANQALSILDAATQRARGEAGSSRVRLGATECAAASLVPGVLARLRETSPRTKVDVSSGSSRQLLDQVLGGEVDAVLVSEIPDDPRLSALSVLTEELVIIAPPTLRSSRELFRALATLTPIVSSEDCTYWQRLRQWYSTQVARTPDPMRLTSIAATLRCVSAGLGLSMLPLSSLGEAAATGRVSLHGVDAELAKLETMLVWPRLKQHPGVSAVRDALPL